MPAIDTNILIRYLVKDDEQQYQQVMNFFENHRDSSLKINLPVVMEAYWVLTSTYKYSKVEFIETFRRLINTQGFQVQSASIIEIALNEFEHSNADFEDCLISVLNESTRDAPTFTFDIKASKLSGMKLLD